MLSNFMPEAWQALRIEAQLMPWPDVLRKHYPATGSDIRRIVGMDKRLAEMQGREALEKDLAALCKSPRVARDATEFLNMLAAPR